MRSVSVVVIVVFGAPPFRLFQCRVFPNGRMNVSAGFEDGCRGGIFCRFMPRRSANACIDVELNGEPLSDICLVGFPCVS